MCHPQGICAKAKADSLANAGRTAKVSTADGFRKFSKLICEDELMGLRA